MLSWQFKTLLGQIQQIEMHESGDCPCILNTQDPPERCLGKHLLNISTLSRETANMSSENKEWLIKLAGEANARHEQFRQHIEPVYYACKVEPSAETKSADSSSKAEKPVDKNIQAGSCTREDLKN